jgi:uncharacterized membrane protein YphA (DoxX/SURF4 family)
VETVIWIAQILLAGLMLMSGLMKLARSKDQLLASGNMDWTEDFTSPQIKGIGTLEVLAAIGLIVPAALDVAPVLTAIAAAGVVLLMLGAAATHLRRGEKQVLPINLAIAALALFIAIERFGPHSL